jgi:hypothetical protein
VSLSREEKRRRFLRTYPEIGSVRDLLGPYVERAELTELDAGAFAAELSRMVTRDSPDVRAVLRRWDALTDEQRSRDHEFDFVLEEARVSSYSYKAMLSTLARDYARQKALAIVGAHMPALAQRGLSVAQGGDEDDKNRTLHRFLEKDGLIDKPGPGVVVNANPTVVAPGSSPAPDADEFSRMLDEALARRPALPAPAVGELESGES